MFGNDAMQVVVCLILVGYCGYMLFSSFKSYKKDKEALAAWQKTHPNAERVNFDKFQGALIIGMSVLCFVLGFFRDVVTPDGQNPLMYQITYFCLGLIFIGLAVEVHIHRQAWFTEDGFYYAAEGYRYRMISSVDEKKSLFIRNARVMLANGKTLDMSKKMGAAVEERWQAWKEAKKEKRSRRKR